MRRSTTMPPPSIEKWTKEDVHHWLMTEVKIHETCADRFSEEEWSGKVLLVCAKKDILDLGLKHGPAVKIKSYLESLKKGSQHDSQSPAYVENWTKEQVTQWLLQHVKVDEKYAERLQEEDVSGDCLVCFKKQDFLDLGLKSGPAILILDELCQLKPEKPEPTPIPILHTSTDQKEATNPITPDLNLAQAMIAKLCIKTDSKTDKTVENTTEKAQQPSKKSSEKDEIQPPTPQNLGVKKKETFVTNVLPEIPKNTRMILKTLDNLSKTDMKTFHFHLKDYSKSKEDPIPWSKLEDKDTMDTTDLMIQNYKSNEALRITIDILKGIGQRELACQLEHNMGQLEQQCLSKETQKKEANQGDKLKDLLTCGENSLDSSNRFVVVVNKSSPEQVPYLKFLNKLKLFCVLDFHPDSNAPGGLCHSYNKPQVANLHTPSQYQGQTDSVKEHLNLYTQTSWVFCNGRHDLDNDSNKELDYKNWFRESYRDVDQLISFICNPEVLRQGRRLIIFLLLSPVDSEKDPIFDTYRSFIKNKEERIITICECQSTYEKWRKLIQEKCDFNIDRLSINELSLSEINGTIMALAPSGRLLPSSGSSAVVLKPKDEDRLTALDMLCLNQCENIHDENSPEFQDFRVKKEEEFYRGGQVKWWNFYFCEKDKEKPFVKRDKYENVKKMIESQLKDSKDMCVLLNLYHHPGCGGTTLAMHVMWDLRKKVRCAVLKDNTLREEEVAIQVSKLMKLESEKPFPVLLIVNDLKETKNPHDLVNCIHKAAEDNLNKTVGDTQHCKVIILNCVRSHSSKELYLPSRTQSKYTQSQYITSSLTPEEQKEFEKKLKELKKTHKKPENFYSFMIIMSNFDHTYIKNLARNTLENFDSGRKEARLFAFLALLNTYAAPSEISLSLCGDFLGMKMIHCEEDSIMDEMKPYSNFLIIDRDKERQGYKGIRILHHTIASACLDELERSCCYKVSDIMMEILHCDLLFSAGVDRQSFMLSVKKMLKDGDEREPFTPLIDKIDTQQGRQTVQEIFEKAVSRGLFTLHDITQSRRLKARTHRPDNRRRRVWRGRGHKSVWCVP